MALRAAHQPRVSASRLAIPWLMAIALLGLPGSVRAQAKEAPPPAKEAAVDGPRVTIDNFTFSPATLTVSSGTTVTWTNEDDMVHTVTASDRRFSSKGLETGQAFSYTFTAPGTYNYYCALHPRMTATVIVK